MMPARWRGSLERLFTPLFLVLCMRVVCGSHDASTTTPDARSVLLTAERQSDKNVDQRYEEEGVDYYEVPNEGCNPPYFEHGQVRQPQWNYSIGEVLEVVCHEGFTVPHIKSSSVHLKCVDLDMWADLRGSQDTPVCERIGACPVPVIDHGLVPRSKNGGYMPGEIAPVLCQAGHSLSPKMHSPFLRCQRDGVWSAWGNHSSIPTCDVTYCGPPKSIHYGKYKLLSSPDGLEDAQDLGHAAEGTKVYYYCQEGYDLVNTEDIIMVCRDGVWTGRMPRCARKLASLSCDDPPQVENGYFSVFPAAEGLKAIYFCNDEYKQFGSATISCVNQQWLGMAPKCLSPTKGCSQPPHLDHGDFHFFRSSERSLEGHVAEGSQVYYVCHSGYKIDHNNASLLSCRNGKWQGPVSYCLKRTQCDAPMDIPQGNWMRLSVHSNNEIGSRIVYECEAGFKAVGATQIECLPSGFWSDYPPRCLQRGLYCDNPGRLANGFYMCQPSHCDYFRVDTELHYVCNKNYAPRAEDHMVQTCLSGGRWSGALPQCMPDDGSGDLMSINTNTLTIVISTSCAILGLLIIVVVAVALQRRVKHHAHLCAPHGVQHSPPPLYNTPSRDHPVAQSTDEHDRVALIAFADGVQVVLPSYEEATRGRHPHRLARFNSDASSHSSSGRSSRGDYRPLPSLPPAMRGDHRGRELTADHRVGDHHRNSIITTTSTTTRDNLSLAFGSMDTVNASDGTSTSVTVDTYDSMASNPSLAMSQRAAAGSIESSSTHNSLANEDAPLLTEHHMSTTETIRSLSSHSQSEINSPIAEVPEIAEDLKPTFTNPGGPIEYCDT